MMKILVCVDKEEFFTPSLLNEILSKNKDNQIWIGVSRNDLKLKTKVKQFFWKISFFKIRGIIKLLFLLSRKYASSFLNIFRKDKKIFLLKDILKKYRITILTFRNINSPQSIQFIKKENFDLIFSFQSVIFKKDLLKAPRIGCINKHAALLPSYRGVWPVFWAYYYNEKYTGLTLHWMDANIDTGNIIVQKMIPIALNDTVFTLYKKVFDELAQLFFQCLEKIREVKSPVSIYQIEPKTSYYSFPTRKEIRNFYNSGKKVI